jgi:hypothetical protein
VSVGNIAQPHVTLRSGSRSCTFVLLLLVSQHIVCYRYLGWDKDDAVG